MAWKQLVSPNLDPEITEGKKVLTDWLGWCLAYAKNAYGAFGNTGDTAWKAWSNCQFGHTDDLPSGVYLPIWFSGYQGMGHVSIYYKRPDGQIQIWSSPISHKPYADVWSSIGEIERRYGVKYVGWSEDIAGVKVIERGSEVSTVGDNEIDQMSWAYFGYGAGQDFIKEHRGTESNTFERFMFNHPVAVAYRAQVSEWRAKAESCKSEVEKPVDEKAVVTNVLVRFWNSLFKK